MQDIRKGGAYNRCGSSLRGALEEEGSHNGPFEHGPRIHVRLKTRVDTTRHDGKCGHSLLVQGTCHQKIATLSIGIGLPWVVGDRFQFWFGFQELFHTLIAVSHTGEAYDTYIGLSYSWQEQFGQLNVSHVTDAYLAFQTLLGGRTFRHSHAPRFVNEHIEFGFGFQKLLGTSLDRIEVGQVTHQGVQFTFGFDGVILFQNGCLGLLEFGRIASRNVDSRSILLQDTGRVDTNPRRCPSHQGYLSRNVGTDGFGSG